MTLFSDEDLSNYVSKWIITLWKWLWSRWPLLRLLCVCCRVSVVATCIWVFMFCFCSLYYYYFFFLQSTLSGRARLTILSHLRAAASQQSNAWLTFYETAAGATGLPNCSEDTLVTNATLKDTHHYLHPEHHYRNQYTKPDQLIKLHYLWKN